MYLCQTDIHVGGKNKERFRFGPTRARTRLTPNGPCSFSLLHMDAVQLYDRVDDGRLQALLVSCR